MASLLPVTNVNGDGERFLSDLGQPTSAGVAKPSPRNKVVPLTLPSMQAGAAYTQQEVAGLETVGAGVGAGAGTAFAYGETMRANSSNDVISLAELPQPLARELTLAGVTSNGSVKLDQLHAALTPKGGGKVQLIREKTFRMPLSKLSPRSRKEMQQFDVDKRY